MMGFVVSMRFDCSCKNAVLFLSAANLVWQQDVSTAFEILATPPEPPSFIAQQATPRVISIIGHEAMTTGRPMLNAAKIAVNVSAMMRYLKFDCIRLFEREVLCFRSCDFCARRNYAKTVSISICSCHDLPNLAGGFPSFEKLRK